jgi:branched-chain amino acid transport system substrate-binding protein
LLLALLLVACRVPGSVRPTVKIGLVAPFEGRYRYVGYDLFPAVRLALREANRAGGVGDVFVELVAYDDGADPHMAPLQARKLAVDPQVVAVIGHFQSHTTVAAAPVYLEAGLPLLAPSMPEPVPALEGAVRVGPDPGRLAEGLLEDVETAGLVSDGGPLGEALVAAAAARPELHLAPIVDPADPLAVDAILDSGVPLVLCAADPLAAGEVLLALRDAGWQGEFVGGADLAAADFVAVAGEAAEGAQFLLPWPLPADVAGGTDFVAHYQAISGGTPPGPWALPAYEAAGRVLQALQSAEGTPTRTSTGRALVSLTEIGYNRWERFYWYRIGTGGRPQSYSR